MNFLCLSLLAYLKNYNNNLIPAQIFGIIADSHSELSSWDEIKWNQPAEKFESSKNVFLCKCMRCAVRWALVDVRQCSLQIPMALCTGVWHPRSTPFVHTRRKQKICIHAKWKAFGCLIATELNQIIQLCFSRSLCYSVAYNIVRARLLFIQLCQKSVELLEPAEKSNDEN